ncbi:MAG: tail fiber protein [Polaribacter sp.]|uniref:phage tail protein n=1 Tax=Polaribacter sp. TaxID=1920175 RepID=UPI002F35713B
MDDFIGIIKLFAGNFAPRQWAFCQGQLLAINQNTALFSILGTTYGGDGRTTFGLPDLRSRVPVGTGHGPGLSTRILGEKVGVEYNILNQTQLPNHTHAASGKTVATSVNITSDLMASSSEATMHTPTAGASLAASNEVNGRGTDPTQSYNTATPDITLNGLSSSAVSIIPAIDVNVTVNPTGGSAAVNNIQPSLGMNYIICMQGIFPPRS